MTVCFFIPRARGNLRNYEFKVLNYVFFCKMHSLTKLDHKNPVYNIGQPVYNLNSVQLFFSSLFSSSLLSLKNINNKTHNFFFLHQVFVSAIKFQNKKKEIEKSQR